MTKSALSLGVPEMDEEHSAIQSLLDKVRNSSDAELPPLLDDVADRLAVHFASEEKLMRDGEVPVLECHKAQHNMILGS